MTRSPPPLRWLPWCAAAGVFVTGVLWRDSVLIACGVAFALHAFNLQMDAGGPWPGWRVAIRCWAMGVASLVAGFGLGVTVLTAELDWWIPSNDRPQDALWVLAAASFACLIARSRLPGKDIRLLADLLMPSAVVFALIASARGWEGVPCGFAALVAPITALVMVLAQWPQVMSLTSKLIMGIVLLQTVKNATIHLAPTGMSSIGT